MNSGITIIGLGPGNPMLVTRQAWEIAHTAPELYLRTAHHPVVDALPPKLVTRSFDHLYETAASFEAVYEEIIETILEMGRRPEGVYYAVPGDPMIAETTGPEITRRARAENIPVQVLSGVSFLEAVYGALGIDPFPHTSLVDAFEISMLHTPPFPCDKPALIAQLHSRRMASEVKLTLNAVYPDEHPVQLVHAAGTDLEVIENLQLYEIDRSDHTGLMTSMYLPPLAVYSSFESLHEVVARLRAPDGCPWDQKQTHQSLRPHLLEEVYEVLDALDADDPDGLAEELGDLLFQIVIHAQIAGEAGDFNAADVIRGIGEKLVRRHPHVFGDLEIESVDGVLQNWERLKAKERAEKGSARDSILDGVPNSFPALAQAAALQRQAARAGFDWPSIDGVFEKVLEEIGELRQADDESEREAELGDLLFVLAHLANWYGVNPEDALRGTSRRFRARFGYLEKAAAREGKKLAEYSLDELNEFWELAKRSEDAGQGSST